MNSKNTATEKNANIATLTAFSIVSVIYFFNAGYSYFYISDIESSDIVMNIALGVMFFCVGLSFIKTNKNT